MIGGLLTIDPGLRDHLGWSYWWDGRLIVAGVDTPVCSYRIDHVVMELPQNYPGLRGDTPNDLIAIAYDAALRIGRLTHAPVQTVLPRGWKGTIRKDIFTRRIMKVATEQGCDIPRVLATTPAALRHNAIDAIGLGLWKKGLLR